MAYQLPTRRLVSQDDAAMIERANVPRSRFTGSWTRKTTFDAGYLIPFLVEEVLPADHLSYDVTAYARMATPLFPLFDNQRVDTHFFFVPNRLLWNNWARFMGEQATPNESIDLLIPQVQSAAGGWPVGSIADHFGIPTVGQETAGVVTKCSALPFRAYNLIWNEWFRDQNLQNSVPVPRDNGDDYGPSTYALLRRNKSHDYFTSALPWPQKFNPPQIPMGGLAPILGLGALTTATPLAASPLVYQTDGDLTTFPYYVKGNAGDPNSIYLQTGDDGTPAVYADLSEATGVAINVLRQAWLVQSLLERDARGGTRYVELIRSHFGVTNPDYRLQRPEYIGGGSTPLQLTPIAQTAPTAGAPVGALGAAGTAAGTHRASYAATEHGWIIGLISVRSELSYGQGMPRAFMRLTRYDHYWPALAALGEQAILRREIYYTGTNYDLEVFGYQERWHEYRTRYSEVTGLFRSYVPGTLDAWHLGQRFNTAPVLGSSFLEENPPMARVLAAGELAAGQQYLADILIQRTAVRALPVYGTPAALGRF